MNKNLKDLLSKYYRYYRHKSINNLKYQAMKDNYQREINYLRLSVSPKCNLRCSYCVDDKNNHLGEETKLMSPQRIKEIVNTFAKIGINKVRLTGGEPLIRKDILKIVKEINTIPEISEIVMTTNGVELQKYIDELVNNNVKRFNISLDTLNDKKYYLLTKGHINKVLTTIEYIRINKLADIKINVVLMKGINDDELYDFLDFANKYEITVRFIELMPIGGAMHFYKQSFLSCNYVKESLSEYLIRLDDDGVSELYQIKNGKGKIGLIRPLTQKFCECCNRIRLTYDGKIKPCLHSSKEIDISNLQGQKLQETITKAILNKPKEHHLEKNKSNSKRNMNAIGG